MPSEADKERFYTRYHDGYRARNKKKKWNGNKDVIDPPISFKVDYVNSKCWFCDILCSDKCLSDFHLNVAFYYLRKRMRYYPLDKFLSCLLADTIFDTYIRELRLNYKEEDEGKRETWSFKDADILLNPMFMREAKHWVLGHVECSYMTLSIYNSFASHAYEEELHDLANGMALILPHLLLSVGFFDERPSNYFDSQLKLFQPMETMFLKSPQRRNCTDCGMHVIISALCLMQDLRFKCLEEIDMALFREKIAVELYNHHIQKDRLYFESEDDKGVRMPRVKFVG